MKKDGIYKLELSSANPYGKYLVLKTYEGVQKARKLPTLDDCKQQIKEWDDDYYGLNNQQIVKIIEYVLKDKDDKIIVKGNIKDVTQVVGCKAKTIYNALCTEGRKVKYNCDNKKLKLNVTKNVQTITNDLINTRVCC